MKRTRFTEEQIVSVLHGASGATTVRDVCRHRITETTFFRWRTRYGGDAEGRGQAPEAARGRESAPQKLVADPSLDVAMLKDVAGRRW